MSSKKCGSSCLPRPGYSTMPVISWSVVLRKELSMPYSNSAVIDRDGYIVEPLPEVAEFNL